MVLTAVPEPVLQAIERELAALSQARYELTLFVNGASERSGRAIADVRALCDAHLAGRFDLRVVDVGADPEMVTRHGVLAAPTLVKSKPSPVRMLVGDLSDPGRMLAALDICAVDATEAVG